MRRFPLGCGAIFALWVVSIVMFGIIDGWFALSDVLKESTLYHLAKLSVFFWLNVVMLTALELGFELFSESGQSVSGGKKFVSKIAVIVANALVAFLLFPLQYETFNILQNSLFSSVIMQRVAYLLGYVIVVSSLVLLTGAMPSLKRSKQMFYLWYELFFTTVTVCFFVAVIMIGVATALGTINIFFGLDLLKLYPYIFITVATLLAPLKGLSLLPSTQTLYKAQIYLSGIYTFFTTKIVAVLVLVYLVLLYLFALKQLMVMSWPEGGVVYAILGLLIPGVILAILYFPYRLEASRKGLYHSLLSRGIHWLSIPMVFMYLASVWVRVSEYGMTLPRYLVLVLGIWLLLFNVYWALAKKLRLAFIPFLIIVLTVVTLYIPGVNMFDISKRSQLRRLEKQLQQQGFLDEQKTQLTRTPSEQDMNEIDMSIVRYLRINHFSKQLQAEKPYLNELIESLPKGSLPRGLEATKTINVTFDSSRNYPRMSTTGNTQVFVRPLFGLDTAQIVLFYQDQTGRELRLEFVRNEDSTITLKIPEENKSFSYDFTPVAESLRPIWSTFTSGRNYQRADFPTDALQQLTVEDERRIYRLFITAITLELSIDPSTSQADAFHRLQNVEAMVVVTQK
jgi:hypothetical protein